jgi:hypothetical protein
MAMYNEARRWLGLPPKPFDLTEGLKELDKFFAGKDRVHKTMHKLVRRLEKAKIPYAVVGGMAVFAHHHRRATNDVDVLLTPEGFAEFRRRFVPKSYAPVPGRPRRFVDRTHEVSFDILVTGLFPGSGAPGPVAFPDPTQVAERIKDVAYADLPTLIQLKLAARRHYDFGDVANLIRVHNLDESFQAKLHPSVHRDYIECLEEKRREDEYEARQDRMLEEKLREKGYGKPEE